LIARGFPRHPSNGPLAATILSRLDTIRLGTSAGTACDPIGQFVGHVQNVRVDFVESCSVFIAFLVQPRHDFFGNGPMLSARGRDAVVASFTSKNDVRQAYAAFSSDAGALVGKSNPPR
jgi:hypothetical protein